MCKANHFNKEFNVIYLRVVQGCNLNCSHCFTLGNRDSYQTAPFEQVRSYLQAIKTNVNPRAAVMYIHGGEPFLASMDYHRQLNALIKEVMGDTVIDIIPQTNLMYKIDDEFIEFLHQEYKGQIGISWDYKIRFGSTSKGLSEDLFFENFRKIVKAGIEPAIAITVQKYLFEQDPVELVQKFEGAKSIDFEFLTYFSEGTNALRVSNDDWSRFYHSIVRYYSENQTTWSLPLVDLFTKSVKENKIYQCKCNCCQHRTFTMNCNGTIGLCPDETYFDSFSTVQEMSTQWEAFETKAKQKYLTQIVQPANAMCQSCEFYDYCGGNCEPTLFNVGDTECPMSKQTLNYQFENMPLFSKKLKEAYKNLTELRPKNLNLEKT